MEKEGLTTKSLSSSTGITRCGDDCTVTGNKLAGSQSKDDGLEKHDEVLRIDLAGREK